MKRPTKRFEPEEDGKGRVNCPVNQKLLEQINSRTPDSPVAAALIAALKKHTDTPNAGN